MHLGMPAGLDLEQYPDFTPFSTLNVRLLPVQ